jgi:hypothetical protein
MRTGPTPQKNSESSTDSGVATMIEYVMVTAVIMTLFIVMLLLVYSNFVESPLTTITYSAFTDIGNGLSTRIVDVYAIAPDDGDISSSFDLPDEIGGRSYVVEINGDTTGQTVDISRDLIVTNVALAGIGATAHGAAGGNTTGAGVNKVSYDSKGYL